MTGHVPSAERATDPTDLDVRTAIVVLRRGWAWAAGLPLAVLLLSLATYAPAPATLEARLRVAVDVPRSALVPGSDEGTAARIGEALIDDISRIIPSQAFAAAVGARLPAPYRVSPGQIASDLSATDRHRVADVWVRRTAPPGASADDLARLEDELRAVALATVAELEDNGAAWFARLGEEHIALTVIDRPVVSALAPSTRQRLEIPMRVGLALLVGVVLAFVRHALDVRLYGADEVEAIIGAPVLGRLPRRRRIRRR